MAFPSWSLGTRSNEDHWGPLITERKCTSTPAFQPVTCAKSPRLQAGIALLRLRPFLDSCRRFASLSPSVYILGSRCNNLLLRTDGQRCEALGNAVKHFRQRIRAFLNYTYFMVASGRCDPPWVTLAECDLATAVNKPVPRVSVYLNAFCDTVYSFLLNSKLWFW